MHHQECNLEKIPEWLTLTSLDPFPIDHHRRYVQVALLEFGDVGTEQEGLGIRSNSHKGTHHGLGGWS